MSKSVAPLAGMRPPGPPPGLRAEVLRAAMETTSGQRTTAGRGWGWLDYAWSAAALVLLCGHVVLGLRDGGSVSDLRATRETPAARAADRDLWREAGLAPPASPRPNGHGEAGRQLPLDELLRTVS